MGSRACPCVTAARAASVPPPAGYGLSTDLLRQAVRGELPEHRLPRLVGRLHVLLGPGLVQAAIQKRDERRMDRPVRFRAVEREGEHEQLSSRAAETPGRADRHRLEYASGVALGAASRRCRSTWISIRLPKSGERKGWKIGCSMNT